MNQSAVAASLPVAALAIALSVSLPASAAMPSPNASCSGQLSQGATPHGASEAEPGMLGATCQGRPRAHLGSSGSRAGSSPSSTANWAPASPSRPRRVRRARRPTGRRPARDRSWPRAAPTWSPGQGQPRPHRAASFARREVERTAELLDPFAHRGDPDALGPRPRLGTAVAHDHLESAVKADA